MYILFFLRFVLRKMFIFSECPLPFAVTGAVFDSDAVSPGGPPPVVPTPVVPVLGPIVLASELLKIVLLPPGTLDLMELSEIVV